MSRMFRSISDTWNVFVGCRHDCTYCNARKAALTRFRHIPRYRDGFTPRLIESELRRRFKPGLFIFVAYMGDIAFATREEFLRILAKIREFPETNFLIQTKNPVQIFDWWHDWSIRLPDNVVFGTTIESNRNYNLTKAPPPVDRFRYLTGYPHPRKFLSIEPIMEFDLDTLVSWVRMLQPDIVEVGADNYHHHLPEPPWEKVEELLKRLREICPRVEEKERLERLKGGS
ncbi:hypothetical protein ES703_38344 [subsurface metagenome]